MADLENMTVQIKIADLPQAQALIAALAPWAAEAIENPDPTVAERALLDATDALADPHNPSTDRAQTGAEAIAAERQRQIKAEGWTPEHDDAQNDAGELCGAASAYALSAACQISPYADPLDETPDAFPHTWPPEWWKPKTPREDLVRAGALIAAEIDRLDRTASIPTSPADPERLTR